MITWTLIIVLVTGGNVTFQMMNGFEHERDCKDAGRQVVEIAALVDFASYHCRKEIPAPIKLKP